MSLQTMIIEEIHNKDLQPYRDNELDIELALKSYVLISKLEESPLYIINKNHQVEAFDFISKQKEEYDTSFVDSYSFTSLNNKFLEMKADIDMVSIQSEQEEANMEDDDLSLSQFLHISSDILTSEESAPIIKFVNSLFYQAVKMKASDIHIEMHEFRSEVRYRIDGILIKHIDLDKNIMSLVISRIKVISHLDISEKRKPQDGRTQVKIANKTLDIRISILPTYYGEKVVMRILMQSESIPEVEKLGFDSIISEQLKIVSKKPHGMILVTGPTGSGKSTTLHSVLHSLATPQKNIITIEDPVEYKSDKINQIQVNEQVGLTFASGLRSILRQDPDIIMVGEIRDEETAKISIQAALTGHLVLSTLHTNSAVATISRLIDMGVERFLLSSCLVGILSQRLIRKLCDECKEIDKDNESYKTKHKIKTDIYTHNGCEKCIYTGYAGRVSIGEFLPVTDEIVEAINNSHSESSIDKIALKLGMQSIENKIKKMVKSGITSVEETIRLGV
jgi:general secretion pathway protein E